MEKMIKSETIVEALKKIEEVELPITIVKLDYPNVINYSSTSGFGLPQRKETDLKPYVSKLRRKLPKTAKLAVQGKKWLITNIIARTPIDKETRSALSKFEKENSWVIVDVNW
jgi:hypothetical protein